MEPNPCFGGVAKLNSEVRSYAEGSWLVGKGGLGGEYDETRPGFLPFDGLDMIKVEAKPLEPKRKVKVGNKNVPNKHPATVLDYYKYNVVSKLYL